LFVDLLIEPVITERWFAQAATVDAARTSARTRRAMRPLPRWFDEDAEVAVAVRTMLCSRAVIVSVDGTAKMAMNL
jgi:hypothetical protein